MDAEAVKRFQDEMVAEFVRQEEKWGDPTEKDLFVMQAVISEEGGEVARAVLERQEGNIRNELVQLATVCMATAVYLDTGKIVW